MPYDPSELFHQAPSLCVLAFVVVFFIRAMGENRREFLRSLDAMQARHEKAESDRFTLLMTTLQENTEQHAKATAGYQEVAGAIKEQDQILVQIRDSFREFSCPAQAVAHAKAAR